MNPTRTGSTRGHFRFDRVFPDPIGRVNTSSGTSKLKRFRELDQLLTDLWDHGQVDALLEVKRGMRPQLLLQAKRAGKLGSASLLADVALRERLWDWTDTDGEHKGAVSRALATMAAGTAGRRPIAPVSRERYELAWLQVQEMASDVLTERATIAALERVSWAAIWAAWPVAPGTRNRARSAISATLSVILGDKYHPFVRALRKAIPREEEPENEREIEPGQFWTLMKHVPEPAIPSYVTLAASGLRVGAFLRTDIPAQLLPAPVYGIKTVGKGSRPHIARVKPEVWDYVVAAVPCRVAKMPVGPWPGLQRDNRYKRLSTWLHAASIATGIPATIHDLRRLFIQVGVDEVGEQQTQKAAGHRTRVMTQRYANRRDKGLVADAVGAALLESRPASKRGRGESRGTPRQRRPRRAS